ncbi:MAG: hypothetical protein ACOYLF_04835 [Blastocatellia bacterium]
MNHRQRYELISRNDFWRNAFFVEWGHQYPERSIEVTPTGHLLASGEWTADLERVAGQCFSTIRMAPADPGRRLIFRRLFSSGRD